MTIFEAAETGDVGFVEKYLKNGGDPCATIDGPWAQTIAYRGYANGHKNIVKAIAEYVLCEGLNVSGVAFFDVLCSACIEGDLEMVKFLYKTGEELRHSTDSYLNDAIKNNRQDIAAYILHVRPKK